MQIRDFCIVGCLILAFAHVAVGVQNVNNGQNHVVLLRADKTPGYHSQAGYVLHRERFLALASQHYAEALSLDPPRHATEEQLARVYKFAPRLYVTPSEPFELKDVAAIIHPDQPIIVYHLFWEEDIDYPNDNDPCDHEVIWVELTTHREKVKNVYAYFHGRIIKAEAEAVREANAHQTGPGINVQWGKHGSLPHGWEDYDIIADRGDVEREWLKLGIPISMRAYMMGTYKKLHSVGRKDLNHPLARTWPKKFDGTYEEFTNFSVEVQARRLLEQKRFIRVSYWNNATIDQHFLSYNFRPKVEWPAGFEPKER